MEDLLEGLNEAQREAVTATEGFVRVIAGAGSGKTRALSHRFAFLVNELGILPGNILCVTFTNKSAAEMRQRIHRVTGDDDTGYNNTFHGFCVSVLQEDSHVVGYPKSFLVLDNADIDAMLQMIYEERRLAFVAVTRAEKGLYLSEADGTNFDGSPRYPSRFLLDMWGTFIPVPEPQEGLLKAARGYAESSNRALPPDDGAVLLPVGQRVRHFVFGLGRVLDVDLNRGAHLVQFDDMETPRRISFRAKLEAWPEDAPSTGERQNSDYE